MAVSILVACGGGGSGRGSGNIDGTIRGASVRVADAISTNYFFSTVPVTSYGVIALSSSGGLCGTWGAGKQPKSSQFLLLAVSDTNPAGQGTAPSGPGSYTVVTNPQTIAKPALVAYFAVDANCQLTSTAGGTSGTVTLSSVANSGYSGTFDVTFDSGDHVTGSFKASNCAGLTTFLDSSMANLTCT
jgi:hypothetical protein